MMRKIKIAHQLMIGFVITIFILLALGFISFRQTENIHRKNSLLYDNSLVVRRAVGELKSNILAIHRNMKDLFLFTEDEQIALNLSDIEQYKRNAYKELDIIYSGYLGDKRDVDSLKIQLMAWDTLRKETISLMYAGKTREAVLRTKSNNIGGSQVDKLLSSLEKISTSSEKTADELYDATIDKKNNLELHMTTMVAFLLFVSSVVNITLMRNIRRPLSTMKSATDKFREGDMSVRVKYYNNNEFGELAVSFNKLAEIIEKQKKQDQLIADLSYQLLSHDDPEQFFNILLRQLILGTNSQTGVIYALSADETMLECVATIGSDTRVKFSFPVDQYDNEFGIAMTSKQIHHLMDVPDSTRFVFNTINGTFIPKEIVTVPIIAGGDIMACITLSSLYHYDPELIEWINKMRTILDARIAGILAYRNMRDLASRLEIQNNELEEQKKELKFQASELEQQNAELETQKAQLNEANKLKSSFLSNMSHELRTPLNSVIALSGVLHRRLGQKIAVEEHDYIKVIERNGKRLLEIINDILDITRIESGRVDVIPTEFQLHELLDEVTALIMPQAVEKKIILSVDTHPEDNVIMKNDFKICYHILQNIIGNAVKFTHEGSVMIRTRRKANKVFIEVEDTGIGIPSDQLENIFDEFRQVDYSTSRKHEGTGLGLAISKKYINILGGKIHVKSEVSKGSLFTIILPVNLKGFSVDNANNKSWNNKTQVNKLHDFAQIAGKKIMLVEDSEPAIIQICDILNEEELYPVVTRNGEEALQKISDFVPDAIILDLMMPGIDGFEVLKQLRENPKTVSVPVLILTAKHITSEELSFLKKNNIHQLINKGDIDKTRLMDVIKQMLLPKV